ncbi:hypothetical protein Dda_2408 [Drechslerella dactyloides]|uniref:Uncharacterized protein n=1 Tax=Drechslerella dactyloides TaxID=74499 RepID=A0AAD6J7F9_DREDA|nr:hypothetical protein Dda_2408 [Drechslerella dactyloides]
MPIYSHNTATRVFLELPIEELGDLGEKIRSWKAHSAFRFLEPQDPDGYYQRAAFDSHLTTSLSLMHSWIFTYRDYCEEIGTIETCLLEAISISRSEPGRENEHRLRQLRDQIQQHLDTVEDAIVHEIYLRNTHRATGGNLTRNNQPVAATGSGSRTNLWHRDGRRVRFDLRDNDDAPARTNDIISDPRNYEDIPYDDSASSLTQQLSSPVQGLEHGTGFPSGQNVPNSTAGSRLRGRRGNSLRSPNTSGDIRPATNRANSNSSIRAIWEYAASIRRPDLNEQDDYTERSDQGWGSSAIASPTDHTPHGTHFTNRIQPTNRYLVPYIMQPAAPTFVPIAPVPALPAAPVPAGIIVHESDVRNDDSDDEYTHFQRMQRWSRR